MDGWILFLVGLTLGLTSSRVTLVIARGGIDTFYMQPAWRSALGALETPAIVAVIIWGFVYLTWYLILAAFIAVSLFIVGPAVTHRTLPAAFLAQPLLDIACASIAVYLWFFF